MGSHSLDAKLRAEATAFAACARSYVATATATADGGTGAAGGSGVGGMPAQAWHECVAVSCGFHACVVGQSLYAPQLRGWFGRHTLALVAAGVRVCVRVRVWVGVRVCGCR